MSNVDFFDQQSDLTASKILIYQKYLEGYLPKVLMQYGKCFIADFFCGPGQNGDQDGSPLVLLNVAAKMLDNPTLKMRWDNPEIVIIFSDVEQCHIDNLKKVLAARDIPSGIKIIGPFCEDFSDILARTRNVFKRLNSPKFFFLDPFTYSTVDIDSVKDLMEFSAPEVLLFLPTFHSYRFKSCADQYPKLKAFLDKFTDKGHEDVTDISEFNEAIGEGLLKYLGLKYVRSIGLDDGSKKNALFYLTTHVTGMIVMNKLVWKYATDGMTIKADKKDNGPTFFNLSPHTGNYQRIKEIFQEYIKAQKQVSNVDVIDFVARQGFTNTYAKEILQKMKDGNLIEVEYLRDDKTRGFYIADAHWDSKLSIIKYKG